MRIHVEAWAPEYGSPLDAEVLPPTAAAVDVDVEVAPAEWRPLQPPDDVAVARRVDFIDGVRRIDARVWITGDDGATHMGICASYAAGVARCDDAEARITTAEVRRGLFAPAGSPALATRAGTYAPLAVAGDDIEHLILGLQQRMGELEIQVAANAGGAGGTGSDAGLVVVDGPLSERQNVPGAVGYVKTHRVAYLPPALADVVARLEPGERTPLFLPQSTWSRYSWYLRLPGPPGHPWAGVVRGEVSADLPLPEARVLADRATRTLPRFASAPHKDPRAPQNLYPIAGLERELRRRLGDAAWVWRALRAAV